MQVDYNMYIRCNQKFMLYKDRGIDFCSVWLCIPYARYTCPALLRIPIPTLRPDRWTKVVFQRFNRGRKPNFRCIRDKKYIT